MKDETKNHISGADKSRPAGSDIKPEHRRMRAARPFRLGSDHLAFARRASVANIASHRLSAQSFVSKHALWDEFSSKYDASKMLRPVAGAFVYRVPGSILSNVYLKWLASVQLFLSIQPLRFLQPSGDTRPDAPTFILQSSTRTIESTKPFVRWQATRAGASARPSDRTASTSTANASTTRASKANVRDASLPGLRDARANVTHLIKPGRLTGTGMVDAPSRAVNRRLDLLLRRDALDETTRRINLNAATSGVTLDRATTARFVRDYDAGKMLNPDAGAFVYITSGMVSNVHLKWLASVQLSLSFPQLNDARLNEMEAALQSFARVIEAKPFACWQATDARTDAGGDLAASTTTASMSDAQRSGLRDARANVTHLVKLRRPAGADDFERPTRAVNRRLDTSLRRAAFDESTPPTLAADVAGRAGNIVSSERIAVGDSYLVLPSQPATLVAAMPRAARYRHDERGREEHDARPMPTPQHWLVRHLSELQERDAVRRLEGATAQVVVVGQRDGRTRSDVWSVDGNGAAETFVRSLNSFKQSVGEGVAPERFTRGFSESFVLVRDGRTDATRVMRRRGGAAASSSDARDAAVFAVRSDERAAARVSWMNDSASFVRSLNSFRWNAGESAVVSSQGSTGEMMPGDFASRPVVLLQEVVRASSAGGRAGRGTDASRNSTSDAGGREDGDDTGGNIFRTGALASLVLTRPKVGERRFEKSNRVPRTPEHLAEAVSRRALEMFVVVSGNSASRARAGASVRRGAGEAARVFGGGVMDASTTLETDDALMPLVSREVGARGEHEFEEEAEGRFESIARELVSLRREAPLRPPRASYVFAQTSRPVAGEPPPQQQTQQQKREEQKNVVEMVRKEIQESMRAGAATVKFSRADYTSIADQVYSTLVRRLMVERERLGIHTR